MKRPGGEYLAAADVLRVLSIGLIGWYHIWQQSWLDPGFTVGSHYVNLQSVVRHGYLLVDVVLVISGFLLALPWARAQLGLGGRPSVKEYYVKRFLRIFPAYALAIGVCVLAWSLPRGDYPSAGFLWKDVITHLTFTHNLFYDTYLLTPLPIVLWTLGVEVQFYLVFPLVARAYEKSPPLTCVVLALFAFAFRLWVYAMEDTTFWVNQLPCMLDLYAIGMAAAWIYVRASRRAISAGTRWLLAAVALAVLPILMQLLYNGVIGEYPDIRRQQLEYRLPLGMLAGVFLVCGSLAPAGLGRVCGNPVTRFLAAISYNFYIWHQTLAVWLKTLRIPACAAEEPNRVGEQPWQTRYTLLCFAAAVAVAALVTYLWEKPLAARGLALYRKRHDSDVS